MSTAELDPSPHRTAGGSSRTEQRSVGPEWDPRIAVLVRPDGRVQLGWTPGRAVILTPPDGVDGRTVKTVLRSLDGATPLATILWSASRLGIPPAVMQELLAHFTRSGFLRPSRVRTGTVRIHGVGPLSDAIGRALDSGGIRTTRSRGYRGGDVVRTWTDDVVVLADDLVTDPRLVSDLVRAGLPHLGVRIRDGNGVIGPMVVPGHSSCLRCADIVRSDLDPHWLHLSAQLLGSAGHTDAAMMHATVALALTEIDAALDGECGPSPASLSATLEIDLRPYRVTTRHWPRQNACSCQYLAPVSGKGGRRQT